MKRRRSSQPKLPFKKKKFSKDSKHSKDMDASDSKFNRKGGKPLAKGKGQKKTMDNFKKSGKGRNLGKTQGKGGRRGARRQPGKQKQGRKK